MILRNSLLHSAAEIIFDLDQKLGKRQEGVSVADQHTPAKPINPLLQAAKERNLPHLERILAPHKIGIYPSLTTATAEPDNVKLVKALLKRGDDVNAVDDNGRTPLMLAISEMYNFEVFEVVKALLQHGANVNAADNAGQTPLMFAVNKKYNFEVVEALLKRGANVNATDNAGQTPLMFALSIDDNDHVVETLLKHGADISIEDSAGTNAVDHAIMLRNNDKYDGLLVIRKILENMERYDLATIEMLLDRVVNNVNNKEDRDILMHHATRIILDLGIRLEKTDGKTPYKGN